MFPGLAHDLLAVCLIGLVLLTAINLFGITESARLLILPTLVFIVSIFAVLIVGPFHPHPVAQIGTPIPIHATTTVTVILLLRAFAAGCSAVTGVEAIANGVPAFRQPRVRTAQRTEVALGILLGMMLIGLATLIRAHHVLPRECSVPLEVIIDPHRSLVRTVVKYIDNIPRDNVTITVLIPEIIPTKRRREILHNQRGRLLETVLKSRTDVVVATLPFHVKA